MTVAYIGLGTNMGDRPGNLEKALQLLAGHMMIAGVSSLYETEPEGYVEQDDFFNCAALAEVNYGAPALLNVLKEVEEQMGRVRSFTAGPRVIDADLLFFGQEVIDQPGLVVPHPRIQERRFVLVPMAEIAGDFMHPVLHKTIYRLLAECASGRRVVKVGPIGLNLAGS